MIILAIGGSVIKTAWEEIKQLAEGKRFNVLVHNGGSLFHDFQRATEKLISPSYTLDQLLTEPELNEKASKKVWEYINWDIVPKNSLTWICRKNNIPVLTFTALGCDFWQMFGGHLDWASFARRSWKDFYTLCKFMQEPFHFISMGSAVIHPEVFTKVLAVVKPKEFRADVVDFKDMYRPRMRVAKYGVYFLCTHKQYLDAWIEKKAVPEIYDPLRYWKPEFQEGTGDD